MNGAPHGDPLDRVTAVLEGQEAAFKELCRRMDEFVRRVDERDAIAAERHEALMTEHRRLQPVERFRGTA